MRTRGGRAVLPSPWIIVGLPDAAAPRPGLAPCKARERREGRAVRPLCYQDSGQDCRAARTTCREISCEMPAFAWTARPWISEIMSGAGSSLVMPGGSGAVATVSSNRSRSSDLKRSRLRYEFRPDWLGGHGTGERRVEFEAAHQFCVAPLVRPLSSAAPSQPASLALYIKCLSREGLRR